MCNVEQVRSDKAETTGETQQDVDNFHAVSDAQIFVADCTCTSISV